jgi:pimeloyl-ACP methyl ester carboxylesterase
VVAPDLPSEDESAGWSEYADAVIDAVGDRTDLVVVAQSLGGFTAPIVCERVPVDLLVLVAAMVPVPGETGSEWWTNSGYQEWVREHEGEDDDGDEIAVFYQDVPPALAAEALGRGGTRPRSRCGSRGRWTPGRKCRRDTCSAGKTGSSPPNSFARWSGNVWASLPMRSTEATLRP